MSEMCETCRYWDYFDKDDDHVGIGACRRYPPVRIVENAAMRDSFGNEPLKPYDHREWDHPTTLDSQWCGEYAPAHITMGMEQVITWARYYVDGETCVEEVPRDELHPEERAGLEELERLESLLPLHSPTQTPR